MMGLLVDGWHSMADGDWIGVVGGMGVLGLESFAILPDIFTEDSIVLVSSWRVIQFHRLWLLAIRVMEAYFFWYLLFVELLVCVFMSNMILDYNWKAALAMNTFGDGGSLRGVVIEGVGGFVEDEFAGVVEQLYL